MTHKNKNYDIDPTSINQSIVRFICRKEITGWAVAQVRCIWANAHSIVKLGFSTYRGGETPESIAMRLGVNNYRSATSPYISKRLLQRSIYVGCLAHGWNINRNRQRFSIKISRSTRQARDVLGGGLAPAPSPLEVKKNNFVLILNMKNFYAKVWTLSKNVHLKCAPPF